MQLLPGALGNAGTAQLAGSQREELQMLHRILHLDPILHPEPSG